MTETATKQPRPTWRDHMDPKGADPGPLMTRPEFVARLTAEGLDVTARTLAYWESEGIIPRSVRQRRDGVPHSMYPFWMLRVVRVVRELQKSGAGNADIREKIIAIPWLAPIELAHGAPESRQQAQEISDDYHDAIGELRPLVMRIARLHERMTGVRVLDTELQLIDANGRRSRLGFGGTVSDVVSYEL